MTTPNLFKFAISELSQDAFICWLLSWADQDYQTGSDKHKALNKIATSVLALFFKKAGNSLPSRIDKIVVKRQVNNIDVLCIINDTYCVLIEDKVGSLQHSDQLVRYKQFMLNGHAQTFAEDKIIAIYMQTHDQTPMLTTSPEKNEFHTSAFYATKIIACRYFSTHQNKINPWHREMF